jgi:signal recognition particle receptor subunit beta
MADFDPEEKKLIVKIVYYGPGLSGKTTNLMHLHKLISPSEKGDLTTLKTQDDHTLFFDLLPLYFKSDNGLKVKLKLFTVPGQVKHNSTRKAVLSRADGVIFIADSQINQSMNNSMSFENLEQNAKQVGLYFDNLPLVIQFNKRDLKNAISEEEIKKRWEPTGLPVVLATAIKAEGVLETFTYLVRLTFKSLNSKYGLEETFGLSEESFIKNITGL